MFDKSQERLLETLKIIPLASQTFSKSYIQYPEKAAPLFARKARGSRIWDIDGNEFIDFVNGLFCVSLGYCDPDVNEAVKKQLEKGSIFSLAAELEGRLAAKLVELIPCAEMVRYGKNGSDATTGAIRIARAYTGRDRVACCGYHGWHDWYIGSTTRNKGIPKAVCELTQTFSYNDLKSLDAVLAEHPGEFAAVIMEPTSLVAPGEGFLSGVKELAHRHGAILIFDEIVTGFHWHLGGAQAYYSVIPDLATFGKAMANGFPISAVVGRKEIMKEVEDIFYSFTFGGDTIALAAALATIEKMEREPVIETCWATGSQVIDGVNKRIATHGLTDVLKLLGSPPWTVFEFSECAGATSWEIKSFFLQEAIKRGILSIGSHNISFAHSNEDIACLMTVYDEVFPLVKQVVERGDIRSELAGKPIEPLFKVR